MDLGTGRPHSRAEAWGFGGFDNEGSSDVQSSWRRHDPLEVASTSNPPHNLGIQDPCVLEGLRSSMSELTEGIGTNPFSSYSISVPNDTAQEGAYANTSAPEALVSRGPRQHEYLRQSTEVGPYSFYGPPTEESGAVFQDLQGDQLFPFDTTEDTKRFLGEIPGMHDVDQDTGMNQVNPTMRVASDNLLRNQCATCRKVFSNPKSLPRHLKEHELRSQKFFCPYPNCKRGENGQGFKRNETRERHAQNCKAAANLDASTSVSSTTPVSKAKASSTSLACAPNRRKDALLERAKSLSNLNDNLPEGQVATLSEIAELQRWRADAGPRITELEALRKSSEDAGLEGFDQVLVDALEELVELQDVDNRFVCRIKDLNASPFRYEDASSGHMGTMAFEPTDF